MKEMLDDKDNFDASWEQLSRAGKDVLRWTLRISSNPTNANTSLTRQEIVSKHKELIGVEGTNQILDNLKKVGFIEENSDGVMPVAGVLDWFKKKESK